MSNTPDVEAPQAAPPTPTPGVRRARTSRSKVTSSGTKMSVRRRANKPSQQTVRPRKIKPGKPQAKTNLDGDMKIYAYAPRFSSIISELQIFPRTRRTPTCPRQTASAAGLPCFLRRLGYAECLAAPEVPQEEPRLSSRPAIGDRGIPQLWRLQRLARHVQRASSTILSSYHSQRTFSIRLLVSRYR